MLVKARMKESEVSEKLLDLLLCAARHIVRSRKDVRSCIMIIGGRMGWMGRQMRI